MVIFLHLNMKHELSIYWTSNFVSFFYFTQFTPRNVVWVTPKNMYSNSWRLLRNRIRIIAVDKRLDCFCCLIWGPHITFQLRISLLTVRYSRIEWRVSALRNVCVFGIISRSCTTFVKRKDYNKKGEMCSLLNGMVGTVGGKRKCWIILKCTQMSYIICGCQEREGTFL